MIVNIVEPELGFRKVRFSLCKVRLKWSSKISKLYLDRSRSSCRQRSLPGSQTRISKVKLEFQVFLSFQVFWCCLQGDHGTGKTRNLVLTFSRRRKQRGFCCDTWKIFETHWKYFWPICKKHVSKFSSCYPEYKFNLEMIVTFTFFTAYLLSLFLCHIYYLNQPNLPWRF